MSVIVQDVLTQGIQLGLGDPEYLLASLTDKIDCIDISAVSYRRVRVGFIERISVCFDEKQIMARGRYVVERNIDDCFLGDKTRRLGHILVERGEVEECNYERVALQTRIPVELRKEYDGLSILPTLVDITINEVCEELMLKEGKLYFIQRTDPDPLLQDLLKTEWFLSAKVREAMKDGKVYPVHYARSRN